MSSSTLQVMMDAMLVRFNGLESLDDCVDALHACFRKQWGPWGDPDGVEAAYNVCMQARHGRQ